MAELKPFHENLLLEVEAPKEKIGSIIVPEAHRSKLNQGKVVDKGPQCSDNVQLGDIVFFPLHSESRLTLDNGQSFVIVPESQCLGSLRKDAPEDKK